MPTDGIGVTSYKQTCILSPYIYLQVCGWERKHGEATVCIPLAPTIGYMLQPILGVTLNFIKPWEPDVETANVSTAKVHIDTDGTCALGFALLFLQS